MNGRPEPLQTKYSFPVIERTLYRLGEDAYDAMVERLLTAVLDNMGGLQPYKFTYTPFSTNGELDRMFVLAEEEFK